MRNNNPASSPASDTIHTDSCNTLSDTDNPDSETQVIVSLWAARIPFIGAIADHHWFVIDRAGVQSRWEVWQKANACRSSWGHLNLNLLPPTAGVGNGEAVLLEQWEGDQAESLATRIEQSPEQYPWCTKYWYWPGPNSNTYVQWVLLGKHKLGRRALGKQFCSVLPTG